MAESDKGVPSAEKLKDARWEGQFYKTDIIAMAEALTELTGQPGWEWVERLLQRLAQAGQDSAFRDSLDNFLFWRGYVVGVQTLRDAFAEIIESGRRLVQEEEASKKVLRMHARNLTGLGGDHDADPMIG